MQLLKHFKTLTLHPKNAQELKGLILQLAIQGTLTSNWRKENPNIESASKLLNRINIDNELVIKGKNNKKEISLNLIHKNEISFEVPSLWKWCRLKFLGKTLTGGTPSKSNQLFFGNDIPFIKPGDIKNGAVNYHNEGLSNLGKDKLGRIAPAGSILMVCLGTIGKCALIDRDCSFNQQINSIHSNHLDSNYLLFALSSRYFYEVAWQNSTSTTIALLNKTNWEKIPLPVPPLEEQKEIVRVVEILFKEVEQLEQLTKERINIKEDFVSSALRQLSTQNTQTEWGYLQNHFKDFFTEKSSIKKLRETVLQLAVQGKLTADWRKNNPETENASELLKRIQKEKAQLIKGKKIKKESPLPAIPKEEIPYELPEGWVWCRMRDVSYSIVPNRDKPKSFTGNITWLTTRNFKLESNKIHHKADDNKLSENELSVYNARLLPIHSVVMSCVGQFGLSAVLEKNYSCNQQLHCFVPLGMVNPFYLDSVIKNSTKILQSASSATTIAYLNKTKCDSLIVALPPLAEQKTIVEKVKFLMGLCDNLEQEVVCNQELNEHLMKSVLREFFEGDLRDKE